jgi:hypothetical protein
VDTEAKRFRQILDWWKQGRYRESSGDVIPEQQVNGFAVARWLAKTLCNQCAVTGKHIPLPYIHYAFLEEDEPAFKVYFAGMADTLLEVSGAYILINWLRPPDQPDQSVAFVNCFGMPFVLSPFSLDGQEAIVMDKFEIPRMEASPRLLDRLQQLHINSGGTLAARISFKW